MLKEPIDITTTATVRPEILDSTLYSFCNGFLNCKTDTYRLIINIDPVGDSDHSPEDVLEIAYRYFDNVVYRIPETPNFASAFRWTWAQTRANYVFHLEDDWELLRDVELSEMFKLFFIVEDLAILRLPYTDAEATRAKQWNKWYDWNGMYMACPQDIVGGLAFSGHPSLIRGDWVRQVVRLLHDNGCPEKQIKHHNPHMNNIIQRYQYGVFQRPHEKKAIRDIGRWWRTEHKFEKVGAYGFTNWRTINEEQRNAP